jgi:hypothetical protein
MPRRFPVLAAMLSLSCAAPLFAQLTQLWTVSQSELVVSWTWPDLDGDGVAELIQEDGVSCWFFDGASSYDLVWTVEDPAPATNTVFGLWLQESGWYVFRQQNSTDQQARLYIYQTGAAAASWSTALLPGNVTEGGIGDFDGDGQLELAWSWHNWDGSVWTSNWAFRTLATGAAEMSDQTGAGYLSGPWPGNVEGDESEELLLDWYWTSGLTQLVCMGAPGVAVDPGLEPESPSLAAWPNPFNPLCHIRLDVAGARPASVGIYNLAGEETRRLPLAGRGPVDLIWDGLDQRGRPAASGTYLVRAGGQALPITLVR